MNKHLKLFMVAAVAVISIVSCKKDKTDDPVTESSCKISKVDVTYNGSPDGSVIFIYDELGRIKSLTEGTSITPYTYSADKITISPKYDPIAYTIANGKVVKDEGVGYSSSSNYTYNAAGYLVTVQRYDGSELKSTISLTYTNNNLTKIVATTSTGLVFTTTNEFSSETASNNLIFVDPIADVVDYQLPISYFGSLSKNLVVKTTRVSSGQSSTYSRVDNFTYTKDSSNKLASKTTVGIYTNYNNGVVSGTPSTSTEKFDFSYDCK